MKLRIKNVDIYGYCGRDFHPKPEDVGRIVYVVFADNTEDQRDIWRDAAYDPAWPINNDNDRQHIEQSTLCFLCITDDGRKLELIEHEVEVVNDMPHFCNGVATYEGAVSPYSQRCGWDEWLCQRCNKVFCSNAACDRFALSHWTETGKQSLGGLDQYGNVCNICFTTKGLPRGAIATVEENDFFEKPPVVPRKRKPWRI